MTDIRSMAMCGCGYVTVEDDVKYNPIKSVAFSVLEPEDGQSLFEPH